MLTSRAPRARLLLPTPTIDPGDTDIDEHVDPFDGAGHGSNDFGWTAALTIDMIERANR